MSAHGVQLLRGGVAGLVWGLTWLAGGGLGSDPLAWAQETDRPRDAYAAERLGWDEMPLRQRLPNSYADRLRQLTDSVLHPPVARDCPQVPLTSGTLPAPPGGPALGVVLSDGRPARWDPLIQLGPELYWPLEDCCTTFGMTLLWDPALFRGELQVDTLAFRFVVGGEVVHCGERAFQMQGPMLYADNRLLLPVSGLEQITEQFLAEQFTFDRDSLLLVQRPLGPVAREILVQQVSGRTYLRWILDSEPVTRLMSDGVSALVVELTGIYIDPRDPPRVESRPGACLQAVHCDPRGSRFVFRVGAGTTGWKTQWREDRGEYQVILTSRQDDLGRWKSYHPWPGADMTSAPADSGRVVLVLPEEEVPDENAASRRAPLAAARAFTAILGERVGTKLEAAGFEVAYLDEADRPVGHGWVPAANAGGGLLALDLRPAICGDSLCLGFRVVTAASRPLQRPLQSLELLTEQRRRLREEWMATGLGDHQDLPPLPRPWHEAAVRHGPASEELAWVLSVHLRAHGFGRAGSPTPPPIVRRQWPAASLEGLDLPGAILYVGRMTREPGFPNDSDWATLEPVAEAIALAIEAYALRQEESR
ncbi:MAG: hypothetical protein KAY32_10665 [Candidatus Eisenbacteria sp.]|nr:hypothetical protein [Candidatus Eisenbacteria bacterium]